MTDIVFEHYDPADERRREALFTLSNGVLSLRGAAPEIAAMQAPSPGYPGLYLAGFYDNAEREVNGECCRVEALVNLPDPLGLSLSLDRRQWMDQPYGSYRQAYEMATCELNRQVSTSLGTYDLHIEECRFVSHAAPDLIALRWRVTCPSPPSGVWLRSTLHLRANELIERNHAYEGSRLRPDERWSSEAGHSAVRACLANGAAVTLACYTGANVPLRWQGPPDQREAWLEWPGDGALIIEKHIRVQPGAVDLEAFSRYLPSGDFGQLQAAHRNAWQQPWDAARVCVAHPELQRPLDFALAHILQTVTPLSLGRDLGFPARGWQEGYHGQIFWDELFAFPFLASHFPDRAQNLLMYRYRRLEAARQRAKALGLTGALYPWRSASSGQEQTPPWLFYPLSGHWVEDPTWRQYHIGAAIAYDGWLLFLATGDRDLLAGMAGEIILEVARCWASMARWDVARGRYVIEGVIGPDEYHNRYPDAAEAGLDNNSYTNLMAAWTLQRAAQVLAELEQPAATDLCERLGISEGELAQWHEVGQKLFLPVLAPGVIGQFEGFDQLRMPPAEWFDGEHPRLDWMLEAEGDSTDRYQITKQADTLMLLHLFPPQEIRELIAHLGYPVPEENGRQAVEYHLSRISHESSLSHTVCAGAMAHVDMAQSWAFFRQCLATDLASNASSGTLEGVHLAAMAGALDVLQRHYLGLRPALDGLHVFPAIPVELGAVALKLRYHGQWLEIAWDGDQLQVQLQREANRAITLVHHQGRTQLAPGQAWQARYPV